MLCNIQLSHCRSIALHTKLQESYSQSLVISMVAPKAYSTELIMALQIKISVMHCLNFEMNYLRWKLVIDLSVACRFLKLEQCVIKVRQADRTVKLGAFVIVVAALLCLHPAFSLESRSRS